jgi:hypothetical protein
MRGDLKGAIVAAGLMCAGLGAQSGTVKITVLDGGTKAPIPSVELKLAGRSSRTGGDGRAQFDNLKAGRYFVEVASPGYLDSWLTGDNKGFEIKEGQDAKEISFHLDRVARLEGRVLDEDGQPLRGVRVEASAMALATAEATSDAEGQFRLENLRAGHARLTLMIPMELRRKTLERDAKTGAMIGYPAAEYYPGVPDPALATTIPVSAGMDLHGYEVRLRRVPLADFTGRTLVRADEPLTGVHVVLQTPGSIPMLDQSLGAREVDAEGGFRFELIPPGSYVLMVFRGDNASGLPYATPIEVAKEGVRDKQILVPASQTIRGMLRAKGDVEWSGGVKITLSTDQKGVTDRDVLLGQSGEFALEDIPPGQWQLEIVANPGTVRVSDQHGLAVTRTQFGLVNPLLDPISVVESGNPVLEVEISADTGRIAGRIAGAQVGFVSIMKLVGARRITVGPSTMVKPDGSFLTGELAPGVYTVVSLGGKPVRVEVRAGETVHVELGANAK